jgi:lipopolysaccharide/colanic/teichoic acid biosynthesis glycosyltransferase
VFKTSSKVILRIKTGSGVILRLLFPGKHSSDAGVKRDRAESGKTANGDVMHLTMTEPARIEPNGGLRSCCRVPAFAAPESSAFQWSKACLDFFAAVVLLVATCPIVLLAMLLIRLTSRGPALYTQTRLGKNGKPFIIYKLRTMEHKCERLTGARWSLPGDPRVTPLGRLLRKTHIDELPQLWNVLLGDMSLVGPRPERPEFVPQLEQAIPHYRSRLLVKPGVTGLAQVQLPPDTNMASVRLKLAYDLFYVRNASFLLDMRIALATSCKLMALPFALVRTAFRFPARELVELSYKQAQVESLNGPSRVHVLQSR